MTKDLLIDFLNDLLVDEKHIIDITFLDKEILPEYMGDRGVIYDIYCTAENGEQFIVEMQNKQHMLLVLHLYNELLSIFGSAIYIIDHPSVAHILGQYFLIEKGYVYYMFFIYQQVVQEIN